MNPQIYNFNGDAQTYFSYFFKIVNSYIFKSDQEVDEDNNQKSLELTALINSFYEKRHCFGKMFTIEVIERIDVFQKKFLEKMK